MSNTLPPQSADPKTHRPLADVARDMLDEGSLWTKGRLPFEATLQPGHPRVMVVAGENCSGKSFFVETLRAWARTHWEALTISVSIRERTGAGLHEGASFRRAMMFGDETEHSTGATSTKVVGSAFSTLRSRSVDDGKSALLVLDEPELGLSEGYARAMGRYLARECAQMHELSTGVVVVTHSRGLARTLGEDLGTPPTFVKLGRPMGLTAWLEATEEHSVDELLALRTQDLETWRLVSQALDTLSKRK